MAAVERWSDDRLDDLAESVSRLQIDSAVDHMKIAAQMSGLDEKVDTLYHGQEAMRRGLERSETKRQEAQDAAVERDKDRRADFRKSLLLFASPIVVALLTLIGLALFKVPPG